MVPESTGVRDRAAPAGHPLRTRNDPAQYDDLAADWWPAYGPFAALQWLAAARAELIPPAPAPGTPLLDIACGGGLLAPYLPLGWRHVGIDLSAPSLRLATEHGVIASRADALRLPFPNGSFRCVVAGEILEHLPDLPGACAELARVLAPGGTLVLDTLADTLVCKVAIVYAAERLPGGPPRHCHDPRLLVDPDRLTALLAASGVRLELIQGLRPSLMGYARWLGRRAYHVRMLPIRSTAAVYQARGSKIREGDA